MSAAVRADVRAESASDRRREAAGARQFWWLLLAIAVVGLAVRVAYVLFVKRHDALVGDEPYFHLQSNWLAEGFGFTVQPGSGVPSALHPPLTSLVLAPASWLASGDAVLGQRLALAVLGVATVVVIGLLGREVAGDRAGLLAAGIAALYPNLWVNDGIIMSESVTALLVASVLLGVYAYIRKPRMKLAALLGALCGLALLTRGELGLLFLVVAAAVLLARESDARAKYRALGIAALTAALLVGPWVAYNLTRFEKPVFVSANVGGSLCGGNNDLAYNGARVGLWVREGCPAPEEPPRDQSDLSSYWTRTSLDYLRDHAGRLPVVVLARVGRVWSVYAPGQMVTFDEGEGRPRAVSWAGLVAFAILLVPAGYGFVVLGRRKTPRYPLAAMFVLVTFTAAVFFGIDRYRVPAEVALVVLAAVGIDAFLDRRRGGAADHTLASASSR